MPLWKKTTLYCDLFSLLASGTAVKRRVVFYHKNTLWSLNKMPFMRKILLLFRKHFFQPNGAGLLSREWLAVCDLFTGQLVCELELKRTAPLGLLPTPNSTNPACCRGKESTPKPNQLFYKCHFWLCICLLN